MAVHNCWWYWECNEKNFNKEFDALVFSGGYLSGSADCWAEAINAYEVDLHSIMDPAFARDGWAEPNSRFFWSADVSVTFGDHLILNFWTDALYWGFEDSDHAVLQTCLSTVINLPIGACPNVFWMSFVFSHKQNLVCNESFSITTCLAHLVNFWLADSLFFRN